MTNRDQSLELHRRLRGKLDVRLKSDITCQNDLALLYSPGVAYPCEEIVSNPVSVYDYTWKQNTVAVISDGSAVLGLGNIGAEASLPVMEGKAILFKRFANVDAIPIVLDTQSVDEIVNTVKRIAPSFGGINLEDISAPRCVEIERRLSNKLDIPVFHDDQHGTAMVVLAGLINALRVVRKKSDAVRVVVCGAGAAGSAIVRILHDYGFTNIVAFDAQGIINKKREQTDSVIEELAEITNINQENLTLEEACINADIFIGVSKGNIVSKKMISSMAKDSIVFALANPYPEISYNDAKEAGAAVVATGRSDFPNQINNVIIFPGLFRGLLDVRSKGVPSSVKLKVAESVANMINDKLSEDFIIPDCFDDRLVDVISNVVKNEILRLRNQGIVI